jgi:hypothetical protein
MTMRRHRRTIERLIFSQTYRCRRCHTRINKGHINIGLFEPFASCPKCGNTAPDKRGKRDKVDPMATGPIRFLHWLFGGRLYHCVFCRLQFYDIRKLMPVPEKFPDPKPDSDPASIAS